MPFDAWQEEFMALLDDATRIRMRSDVPFGAFLSGGVDSSSIVGLMARHNAQPTKTFCIGFADSRFDESAHAQEAATRFGTEHTMEVAELDMLARWAKCVYHCDQPHGDASFMPTLRVSELAAKHVKVVLTGDGGDELFAGYEKYQSFFSKPSAEAMHRDDFANAYFDSVSVFGADAKSRLYRPGLAAQLRDSDVCTDTLKPWFAQAAHMDRLNQALFFDTQSLLSGNNLVKPDRMGMAVSIENRSPFLDWRMIEFAFRTPGAHKLHEGDLKHRYKKAVAPLIGEHLAHRKKQMFTVPIGEWFRGDRFGWLSGLLTGSPLIGGLFEPAEVSVLLNAHREGTANYTRELRLLASIALWAETFAMQP
jgi:asparagine synthase (glutamine-hydrolysing)